MPHKDPAKRRECNRRWRENNPERHKEQSRRARAKDRAFRKELLAQFPCICCGEPDPDLIEWHHVNPEDKSFGVIAGSSYSHASWWEEVLKCVPVCPTCHVKIHKGKLCLLPQTL